MSQPVVSISPAAYVSTPSWRLLKNQHHWASGAQTRALRLTVDSFFAHLPPSLHHTLPSVLPLGCISDCPFTWSPPCPGFISPNLVLSSSILIGPRFVLVPRSPCSTHSTTKNREIFVKPAGSYCSSDHVLLYSLAT